MRLKNQAVLVTGSASGIGKAIALKCAREGASVAVADLDVEGVEQTSEAIRSFNGVSLSVAMDVTDEKSVEDGVDFVLRTYGRIDVVVSNAGVQQIGAVVDLSFYDWKRVLAVHLDGSFLTTRATMRHMVADGQGGTILYMGSVHSKAASPLKAPYVTAKHGLLGLCRTVAREGSAHGIRSNVICPGFVRTPLVEKQIPEQAAELGISEERVIQDIMLRHTVDGEFTTTADVAETALFLATFPSSAKTGQAIIVSHGWHME